MQIKGGPATPVAFSDLMGIAPNLPKSEQKNMLRFSESKGVYTNQGLSLARLSDFLTRSTQRMDARDKKVEAAVTWIKGDIDKKYGDGTADRVFKSIAQNTGVDLNKGVKVGDLAKIEKEIKSINAFMKNMPSGMQILPSGRVSGSQDIHETFPKAAQPERNIAAKPKRTLSAALTETGKDQIDKALLAAAKNKTDSPHGITLPQRTSDDLPRMNYKLHVPQIPDNSKPDSPAEMVYNSYQSADSPSDFKDKWLGQLVKLAGSPQAATVLSSVMNQDSLGVLYSQIPTSDGKQVRFTMPNSKDPNTTYTNQMGVKVGVSPKQYSGAAIDVSKNDDGDFELKINWKLYVNGVKEENGENIKANLDPDDTIQVSMKSTWVIDGKAAQKGELVLNSEPIHVSYEGKLAS